MAQIFRHQDDDHGHDQQHGIGFKHRTVEGGQAQPRSVGHAAQIDWLAQAQTIGQHGVDDAGHDQANQDQQALHHALGEHGHQSYRDKGDGLHPGFKVVGCHVLDGNGRQIQANHGHHGAGYDGGHKALNPAGANDMHQHADQGVDQTAGNDAAQCHTDVAVGTLACKAGGCNHHADEGEGRTQVAGHFAAGDEEEDQGADTAHQYGHVGVKAHEDGGQHGGAKHGDHVLNAHQAGLCPGQALIRPDDAAVLQHGGGLLSPGKHSHLYCSVKIAGAMLEAFPRARHDRAAHTCCRVS